MAHPFKAMVVTEGQDGTFRRDITERSTDDLPGGDLLIAVQWSSLNYKDALSATGNRGVTRQYPHTPGIDAAGTVAESRDDRFNNGDPVLVTGYDLGMNTPGGFGQYIRVPAQWAVKLPTGLTARESMIYGTAGFTAALSVLRLTDLDITPDRGRILVTGASGGVGSMAVAILARSGYQVAACSGKAAAESFLLELGAQEVVPRQALLDSDDRPLLKGQWIGVVDTVGGAILATALKSTAQHGAVTSCGNVADYRLHTTVFPFILRGISLLGIDSAACPMQRRLQAWEKLAGDWKIDNLERLCTEISLNELDSYIDRILNGQLRGRTLIGLT